MVYEYILLQYNDIEQRTERKYGVVTGKNDSEALAYLGKRYDIIRIEYFACVSEDNQDYVYEFNDDWANNFEWSGRKFGKMIPPLNKIPENDNIYE